MDKEAHEQRNGMDRHGQGQCPGSVWAKAEKKNNPNPKFFKDEQCR